MTIEENVLFCIYKLAKEREDPVFSIWRINIPFEAIKENFPDIPESKLEYIISDIFKKGWISVNELKVGTEFTTDSLVPGKFGTVELRVTSDGIDKMSEIINQH